MSKPKPKKPIWKKILLVLLIVFIALFLIGAIAGSVVLAKFLREAPSVEDVEIVPDLPTVVYDINGDEFTKFMMENREWVPLEEMPENLKNAVVAIEDHTFYEHNGINVYRILGALWTNLRSGSIEQGGSTITTQLAKNAFLTHEQTLKRKVYEVLYAFQIERRYTKDEILELYLNYIYYGENYYGVQTASKKYLAKDVRKLTLSESAFIAGILQNANYLNPFTHTDRAIARRNTVLNRMADLGYITREEAEAAKAEEIVLSDRSSTSEPVGTYFRYMVRDYLLKQYGSEKVYGGGMQVYITIDLKVQKAAEKALYAELPVGRTTEINGVTMEYPQGALVCLDVETGQIRALVGGRGNDEFNRAINSKRTPGSSFKPFVYVAAIDNGFSPASMMEDKPLTYSSGGGAPWTPSNYNKKYTGWMTLRTAMEQSTNTVAIQVAEKVGIQTILNYAKKMGISTLVETGQPNDLNLPTALGGITNGTIPLEMASAYGVLANKGVKTEPYFVIEVKDRNGKVLESNKPQKSVVLSEVTSYLVTSMMQNVITGPTGTGSNARTGIPSAGKTGTADDNTDVWFVGFTSKLVTAVWIGEDTVKQMNYPKIGTIGSGRPARIWAAFTKEANKYYPGQSFTVPAGITEASVCKASGLLSTTFCPSGDVIKDVFATSNVPKSYCNIHGGNTLLDDDEDFDHIIEEEGSPSEDIPLEEE